MYFSFATNLKMTAAVTTWGWTMTLIVFEFQVYFLNSYVMGIGGSSNLVKIHD